MKQKSKLDACSHECMLSRRGNRKRLFLLYQVASFQNFIIKYNVCSMLLPFLILLLLESESEVAQLCPTLWDPVDCSLPGSSIHGISQARILEWVAISFSGGSCWPREWIRVSCIAGRHFTVWATRSYHYYHCCCYWSIA